MNRRELLLALTVPLALRYAPSRAAEVRAHLQLKRQPNWDKTCVSCIPGELFGMDGILPEKLCDTVELSFEDNKANASAIPSGTYVANIRTDRTKAWMKDDISEWRLELAGVPGGRRAIQFHYGKDAGWSRGCIIVGTNNPLVCGSSECKFSDSPLAGVKKLRDYVMQYTKASDNLVEIVIA